MSLLARRQSRRRSGSASVELAVVAPLLATLLLGAWEVGRMIEASQILNNAAREGARSASTGFQTIAQVQDTVQDYLSNAGINNTGCTVTIYNLTTNPTPGPSAPSDDPTTANQGDHLRVIVTLPFNNVKWVVLNQLTSVTTLKATADWGCMRDQALVVDSTMPIN